MSNFENVKMGVCQVTYLGSDYGHTKGGVKVSYKPIYEDITVDKYGKSVVDKVLTGEEVTVKVPLAESQIANIQKALANAVSANTNKAYKFGSQAGYRLAPHGGELKLHPLASADASDDFILYKAVIAGDTELDYSVDGVKVVELTFNALVDDTKADGNLLGHIGYLS